MRHRVFATVARIVRDLAGQVCVERIASKAPVAIADPAVVEKMEQRKLLSHTLAILSRRVPVAVPNASTAQAASQITLASHRTPEFKLVGSHPELSTLVNRKVNTSAASHNAEGKSRLDSKRDSSVSVFSSKAERIRKPNAAGSSGNPGYDVSITDGAGNGTQGSGKAATPLEVPVTTLSVNVIVKESASGVPVNPPLDIVLKKESKNNGAFVAATATLGTGGSAMGGTGTEAQTLTFPAGTTAGTYTFIGNLKNTSETVTFTVTIN